MVGFVFTPQSARHPNRPYAGNSNGSVHVPSPHTSSTQTGSAVCASQSRISSGDPIVRLGEPSPLSGTIAFRTEDTTSYALKTSDWTYTTTM